MKVTTFALVATAGLALAACSGGSPDEQPVAETNVANIVEPPMNLANEVMIEAPAAARVDNVAAEAPPVAELVPDEQTQADAEATGMTARVDRSAPANDTQPAQQ